MNYSFKSVWFGALLRPLCWEYTIDNMPFNVSLVLICAFFMSFASCVWPVLWYLSLVLFLLWLCGIIPIIVTPRLKFQLVSKDKTLRVFCYGKQNKDNSLNDCFLRVLMQNRYSSKWQVVEKPIDAVYDSSFLSSGFFLMKTNYAQWSLLGNDYDVQGKPFLLGFKLADCCFFSKSQVAKSAKYATNTVKFINGKSVIPFECDNAQKVKNVRFDDKTIRYEPIDKLDDYLEKAFFPRMMKGEFVLIQHYGFYYLYEIFKVHEISIVCQVISKHFFCEDKSGKVGYYKLNPNGEFCVRIY